MNDRLGLASASGPEKHTSTLAYRALPQPIQASSGYGWPVSRADFNFGRIPAEGLTRSARATEILDSVMI